MTKRVLMVVSNPAVSTTTGWPVGFWASELIHPYEAFTKQGYAVTIASPDGGKVEPDALSDPRDASGYSKDDRLSAAWLEKPDFTKLLENTPSVGTLDPADFDAIVIAGGQGPMFTFEKATGLHKAFAAFYEAGKVSAALCHGTALLLYIEENGAPFLKGKRITGFTNQEEDFADQAVGQRVMPFRIEDRARELGATFFARTPFGPHAMRDGRLITGQQQNSGAETAKLVIESLEGGFEARRVAMIGLGNVGFGLADNLVRVGHSVTVGIRESQPSERVREAVERNPAIAVAPLTEAVAGAEVIFLATPFQAAEEALNGAGDLTGKILVDCTNPVGPGLTHGLDNRQSGGEFIQGLAPTAKVVKAFTVYGYENFVDSRYPGYGELLPAMPIAGNDADAKALIFALCRNLGWEPVDVGGIAASLHLEHQTLLWIKMARVAGQGADFVWARLTRSGQ
jgi:predicted dinucleotide-binding enzyme/putative intracellular protease/amidase